MPPSPRRAGGAGGHSQPVPLGRRRPCAISRLRLAAAGLGASAAVRERCGSAAGMDGSAAVRERCGSAAGMDGGAAGMGGPCGAGALRFRPRSRLEVCGRAGDGCFLKSQALSVPESSVGGLRLVWGIFLLFFFFPF